MTVLRGMLNDLDIPKDFPSIINMDIFFFGLIYEVMFRHKKIDITKKNELSNRLQEKINELRHEANHSQTPALLKYMRKRISESLDIYSEYAIVR